MSDWLREEGVTCVVCPACAFTFDAFHTDKDGGYSCPVCTEQAAAGRAREQEREAVERELLGLLKGEFSSLSIGFNDDAACNYMTATEAIDNGMLERADWVNDEEEQRAKETNSIWTIQWYPDTPVGFCCYAASSLGALLAAIRARTEGGGE